MKTFGSLITGLKGTIAIPWRSFASVPALILFWLQLRRLTAALDDLFNAWRAGDLPPQQSAAAEPAPAPVRTPVADRPRPVRQAAVPPRPRIPHSAAARAESAPRSAIVLPQAVYLPLRPLRLKSAAFPRQSMSRKKATFPVEGRIAY